MVGEAVDQVEVDGVDAAGTQAIGAGFGDCEGLVAVHCGLHSFVEILHAEAGAGAADLGQRVEDFGGDGARIDFDGDFGALGEGEMAAQGGHDFAHPRAWHGCRCAAAPVQMADREALAGGGAEQLDFA